MERHVLNMFWQLDDAKGIPSETKFLFELTEQVRRKDAWLNYVLRCDRQGAEPWEVANVILFLASDLSSYMTGEVISVSSQQA